MFMRSLIVLLAVVLGGCGSLLPRGSSDTPTGFENFAQAQAAAERVVGLQTRTGELKGLGFDTVAGPNVTLIPYPEIVARLAPYPGVPIEKLDRGIRQCIEAQSACRGYLFHFERQDRRREGSFWLDFLNIRRSTYVTGWWFDALIVVSDDTVLFRNVGGQASLNRTEKQLNPLGPFQPSGESAGALLIH
jgi:hypothetical protein